VQELDYSIATGNHPLEKKQNKKDERKTYILPAC
jgi:hypothetical protein